MFFRGSQDVIGATKLDEKMLEEIRNQEKILAESAENSEDEPTVESRYEPAGVVEGDTNQTTLFGGDE